MATERQLQSQIASLRKNLVGSGGITSDVRSYAKEVAEGKKTLADVESEIRQKEADRIAGRAKLDAMKLKSREKVAAARARQAAEDPTNVEKQAALQKAQQRLAELSGTTVDPNRVQAVTDLYWNTLYRAPDAEGLAFYTTGGGKDIPINELAGVFQNEPEGRQVANVENLYTKYLGRAPDAEGVRYYLDLFGETIDPSEVARFIDTGRQQSTETLTQAALDFLNDFQGDLTGGDLTGGDLTGGDLTGGDLTGGDLTNLDDRTRVIGLYEDLLGRTPSDVEVNGWLSNLGENYTFDDLIRDFRIGAQQELGYRQRQDFVRNIPEFEPTAVPQIEFPTEQPLRPILGLTGLPTTSQNIQNLYQSYLGRTPSPQEIAIQQQIMGPVISPLKAYDFSYAAADELAGAQGPRNFGGASLLVPPTSFTTPAPAPAPVESRAGGMINYQEGGDVEGGMAKATPAELGSKFDISEFIDEEGRLVGGYSRPIRDEFGVIIGYENRPYEEDVVFGEELRRRQAAAPLDSEQAMLDMLARQGRTGVNPMTGGLAGIRVGDPMMRSRPQYYSTIEAGRRYPGFAKGGLADIAQDLASKGRFGDTMVAHISPQEAGLLKAMGGSGTINPETGLPEFFSLFPKKGIKLNLGPLGDIKVGAKSSGLLQAAGALALGDLAGLSAAQSALAYGGVRAAATGNLMEGIQAGLTAYGMGNMYEGLSGTTIGTPSGTAPIDTGQVGAGAGGGAAEAAQVASQQVNPLAPGRELITTPEQFSAASKAAEFSRGQVPLDAPIEIQAVSPQNAASASQGFLERNLPASVREYTPDFLLDASGKTLLMGAGLAGTAAGMASDQAKAKEMAARYAAEQEKKRRRFDPQVAYLQSIPIYGRSGGLMKLAGGGMTYMEAGGTTGPTGTPRDVTGTGDGMSDSVPATIEGVQEARLADGEFVIPADVVADIGNGSSDAGSKKLYDMMDRIRMARHGTTEQPPEIKAERLMPA